jgi:hypothetical protein
MVSAWNSLAGCVDFALEDARIVTQKKVDSARDVWVGAPGTGKSIAALSQCYNVARNISRILHRGDPDHWQEYFPYWDTIICIDKDRMLKVVSADLAPHTVIMLDEIQKTGNSRDSLKDDNRLFVDLWQVGRPRRYVIVGTIQEIFAQDKQSRHLYTHFFETTPVNAFSLGMNFGKGKYGRLNALEMGSKQTFYVYSREHGKIWSMVATALPDKKLYDYYNKMRDEEMRKDADRQADERKHRKELQTIKDERALGGPTKRVQIMQSALIDNPKLSPKALADLANCSLAYAKETKRNLGFTKGGR